MTEEEKKSVVDHWKVPEETFAFKIISKLLTFITTLFIWIIMYVLNRTKFYGKEIIMKENAPYVFASNHTTIFDSGFIDCSAFFRKSLLSYRYLPYHTPEYGNFYKNSLLSWYMDHVKCIPLERGKGIDQFAQKIVTQKLKEGNIVHIFPEGTRSRTGELLPGKAGVGKRVYESRVKVIPCYHEGLRSMLPVGKTIPKFGNRIRIIIGEPIFFEEYFEMENVPETWRKISDRIMEEITKLKEKLHELEA
ncbi:MAG TPA: lysophospholipid acyltransferase family protein [Clostridiales bacterium]|nr:lysophospholipid acyltransferase family protein [Clostridiales bacterium]HQP69443.1 lysophospholipid acyltransferase family protein [Clostridiales bacterium]